MALIRPVAVVSYLLTAPLSGASVTKRHKIGLGDYTEELEKKDAASRLFDHK